MFLVIHAKSTKPDAAEVLRDPSSTGNIADTIRVTKARTRFNQPDSLNESHLHTPRCGMTHNFSETYIDTEPGPAQLVYLRLSGWVCAVYGAGALRKIIVINDPDSPVPAMRTYTVSPNENAVNSVATPVLPRAALR